MLYGNTGINKILGLDDLVKKNKITRNIIRQRNNGDFSVVFISPFYLTAVSGERLVKHVGSAVRQIAWIQIQALTITGCELEQLLKFVVPQLPHVN